jgi:hypothetical protein
MEIEFELLLDRAFHTLMWACAEQDRRSETSVGAALAPSGMTERNSLNRSV